MAVRRKTPLRVSGRVRPPTQARSRLEELARAQRLGKERPNYEAVADGIWRSEEEVEEFVRLIYELRGKSSV